MQLLHRQQLAAVVQLSPTSRGLFTAVIQRSCSLQLISFVVAAHRLRPPRSSPQPCALTGSSRCPGSACTFSSHRSKLTVCFGQVEPISSCEDNIAFPGLPIKAILQAEQREIQNSHQMAVRQMEAVNQV